MSEEATINPDGSQTFPDPTVTGDDAGADPGAGAEDIPEDIPTEEEISGIDPAIYLALAALAFVFIFVMLRIRRKRATADVDDFFSNLDGEKVSFDAAVFILPVNYRNNIIYTSLFHLVLLV